SLQSRLSLGLGAPQAVVHLAEPKGIEKADPAAGFRSPRPDPARERSGGILLPGLPGSSRMEPQSSGGRLILQGSSQGSSPAPGPDSKESLDLVREKSGLLVPRNTRSQQDWKEILSRWKKLSRTEKVTAIRLDRLPRPRLAEYLIRAQRPLRI